MRRLMKFLAAALYAVGASPTYAQAYDMPVQATLLPGWERSDGTRIAGVRLSLEPGWKTYWRAPGDAGIPPQFSWSRSDNLRAVGIEWPAPSVFLTSGMRTIGYSGDVVLPVVLRATDTDAPIRIDATIDLGICRDICIPHRVRLQADITDQNTNPTPAIAAALAARPLSAGEAGVRGATCALRPTKDGLEITAALQMPDARGDEVVIIEPGPGNLWMSETEVTRNGGQLTATGEAMRSDGAAIALDRSQIVITVLGRNQAVEVRGCAPT